MLLAAEHPFRKVIGIELNPTLADIARHNLTTWQCDQKGPSTLAGRLRGRS